MTKKMVLFLVSLFWSLLSISSVNAADVWTKIKDSSGIKLYERSVPDTGFKEYLAVTTIDAKMEVIGEALRDVAQFPRWIPDCVGAQIKKKYDRNTFVMYLVLNPLLIEKRDIVLKDETVYDYENGNAKISFFCTDEVKVPVEKKRTRVTVMNGSYKMEYLGRDRTKFIYKLKVDPAGDIPKIIAYTVMKNYPFDTLKKLKKIVADGKYAAAAKGSEDEREINIRAVDENIVRKIFSNNMLRVVEDKALLAEIIAADSENIKNIAVSGGSYGAVEKAAKNAYLKYIDKTVGDKKTVEKLKNNKKLLAEITDLVTTNCEANHDTVDSLVARYTR